MNQNIIEWVVAAVGLSFNSNRINNVLDGIDLVFIWSSLNVQVSMDIYWIWTLWLQASEVKKYLVCLFVGVDKSEKKTKYHWIQ